jgi:hypothetical protein
MPGQYLLTWQPATRHQLVTWGVHGTLGMGRRVAPHWPAPLSLSSSSSPQFFSTYFFPRLSLVRSPLQASIFPLPCSPIFSSSGSALSQFSSPFPLFPISKKPCLLLWSPIGRPSRSPSSLPSPLLRRTPTPPAIAYGELLLLHHRVTFLSGPVSLHLR